MRKILCLLLLACLLAGCAPQSEYIPNGGGLFEDGATVPPTQPADNGELILVGRANDTINLGGLKVAPLEVEELVMRAECVDECLLIPVSKGGTVAALKLLVVLKEGKELDEAGIRKLITDNLEPYKLPKQITVIDEIIRTFNGKIDRKQMIAKYQ